MNKTYVRARDKFARLKPAFTLADKLVRILPKAMRIRLLTDMKKGEGLFSIGVRYVFFKSVAKECGDAVGIYSNVYLRNPQNISVGTNVTLQPMVFIEASGGVTIGSDTSLACGVTIMSETHVYENPDVPFKCQGMIYRPVVIGEDVWIGTKATIMGGVTVGKKAVIGANSVVTRDVPDYAVVVGSPARVIKYRGEKA